MWRSVSMMLVSLLLGGLGVLALVGFIALGRQIGALADELRDARSSDAHRLAVQLDSIADKQQGTRLDLARMSRRIGELTLHIEGPPSLRHPTLASVSEDASPGAISDVV